MQHWHGASAALAFAATVFAAVAAGGAQGRTPDFVSLRSNEVNLRAGPGTQYPVEWVFLRRALPVELIATYGHWRKVRDFDGSEGWVHQSLLSRRRSIMVTDGTHTLREEPAADATPVLRAEAGVLGRLLDCDGAWCRVEIARRRGWMARRYLWGAHRPGEGRDTRQAEQPREGRGRD